MKSAELARLQFALEAKRLELEEMLRNRDVIAVDSSADLFDQIQRASERDMAIGNMIDIVNGDIVMGDNIFLIHSGLTKDEFLNSKLHTEVLNEQVHTFSNYFLKPQWIGNHNFQCPYFSTPKIGLILFK